MPYAVSRQAIRYFLLNQQYLLASGKVVRLTDIPTDLIYEEEGLNHLINHLEAVQIDPVAAAAQNQHLVLSQRLNHYVPQMLEQYLERGGIFEYWANAMCVIPMQDYAIFELKRRQIEQRLAPEIDSFRETVHDVLALLEKEGPLPANAFTTERRVHGYWDNVHPKTKATSHVLNLLNDTGRIQVVKRIGTTRYFDLKERAVPHNLLDEARRMDDRECKQHLIDKYIRAFRIFDTRDPRFGWHKMHATDKRAAIETRIQSGELVELEIEGLNRAYFALADDWELLNTIEQHVRKQELKKYDQIRLLPPLDNLLWRRDRIEDFFNFTYTWEVYTPAAKRKYGYYAMPILMGDQFIGRLDPRLDRKNSSLNVELLQLEPHIRITKTLQRKLTRALTDFAKWHGVSLGQIRAFDPPHLTLHE